MYIVVNKALLGGDIKNFRITDPTDEEKEICYASLEGPQAAAYERGSCLAALVSL